MASQGARVAVLDLARAEPAAAAAQPRCRSPGPGGRRDRQGVLRGRRRRGAESLRPHRRAGQQRRHHAAGEDLRHHRRRLRPHPRRQPARHAVHVAGRAADDAGAKSGSIVCISSVSAQRGGGILGGPHYSAAKAGVLGLARAMARRVRPDNIRVNSITPGLIGTDIIRASSPRRRRPRSPKRSRSPGWAAPSDIRRRLRLPRQRPLAVLHRHHARRERRHVDPLTPHPFVPPSQETSSMQRKTFVRAALAGRRHRLPVPSRPRPRP